MILMVNVWDIKPFCHIPSDGYLLLTLFYLLFSFFLFPDRKFRFFSKQMIPFWLIVTGMILSIIPAMIFHGQSVSQSILTYRSQLLWIAVPVVCRLRPHKRNIMDASLLFTVMMFCVTVLHSFIPDLFAAPSESDYFHKAEYLVSGYAIAIFPLIISMEKLRYNVDIKSIVIVLFCLFFFFVIQNRTSIIAAVAVVCVMLFNSKTKFKYVFYISFCVLAIVFVFATVDTWTALFNETVSDLADEDYNRNKAYFYFLSPFANPSWVTYLTGNGYLSAHSTSLMADMMSEGVYNSDVGYVGFWNQFGILPIIGFFYMIFRGLFRPSVSKIPFACAIYMLATSMTIGYYAGSSSVLCFVFVYYLIMYCTDHKKIAVLKMVPEEIIVRP